VKFWEGDVYITLSVKIENIFERLLAQLKKYKLSLEKKYTNESHIENKKRTMLFI